MTDPKREFLNHYRDLCCRFGYSINGGVLEPLDKKKQIYYWSRPTPTAGVTLQTITCETKK